MWQRVVAGGEVRTAGIDGQEICPLGQTLHGV
jgi:hypothetical protein